MILSFFEFGKWWSNWKFKVYKTVTAFLNEVFLLPFFITFFNYIKMSNNSSAKYYQSNKERIQQKNSWNISKCF